MSFSEGNIEELMMRGRAAAQSGNPRDHEEAELYLEWVLRTDADLDEQKEAWYWLSRIAKTHERCRDCLMNVLAIQPTHADARRDLAILDGRLKAGDLRVRPLEEGQPVSPSALVAAGASKSFRCPKCGAAASYDANIGGLRCQFCGTRLDNDGQIAQPEPSSVLGDVDAVGEQDWVAAIYTEAGHRWAVPHDRVLECRGCGSTVTFTEARVSTTCAYCGASYSVGVASHDLKEPNGAVTFTLEAQDASAQVRKWLEERSRHFSVPDDLHELAALGVPVPIYLPFWSFDIGGEVRWSGYLRADLDIGGVSMDNVDSGAHLGAMGLGLLTGNVEITAQAASGMASKRSGKRNSVPSVGAVPMILDDVLVPATSSLPAEMLAKLEFDTRQAVPYREEMLAAWPAEIYTRSLSDASLLARERAVEQSNEEVKQQTGVEVGGGYANLIVDRSGLAIMSYKLMLMPVWTLEYTYKGQAYRAVVNGQNGDVCGDTPRSTNPIARLFGK